MRSVFPKLSVKNVALALLVVLPAFVVLYVLLPMTLPWGNVAIIMGLGALLLTTLWGYYRRARLGPPRPRPNARVSRAE
ncbi:MAG: hypothetical protein AAGI71_01115 [Bacteroidota bacterium]